MNGPGDELPRGAPAKRGRGALLAALAGGAALIAAFLMFGSRDRGGDSHGRGGGEPPRQRALPPEEESLVSGHELRDMRTRQVVYWLGLLTIAVTLLVIGVTIFEIRVLGHAGPLVPVIDDPPRVTPPPQPRLETKNGEVLAAQRAAENDILNNYTWADEAAGTVRIPIDRAIDLTLERGLPVRPKTDATGVPGLTLPQGSSSGRTLERIP